MWLLTHSRLFNIYFCHKVLLFVWIFTQCNPVRGNPNIATVTKARCYAHCLTENPAINETGIPCQTSACKECLGPCESSYPDEAACKQTCKTSRYCQDSCEFLTKVKTLSSLITGDGSLLPTPRNLTVTNRGFTSISLQWEAVKNTNGSPVYLIEMEASRGEAKYSPIYMQEVFAVPQATISLPKLCSYTAVAVWRVNFQWPLSFKFKVAVLTENSSLSIGEQTVQTTLVKPEPVKNVTVERIEYKSINVFPFRLLKATISLITPKDYKHPITSYYLQWREDPRRCTSPIFRRTYLRPNETTWLLNMNLNVMWCNHFFIKVFSRIGCSTSDTVTFSYTFPGCQNITNLPKNECFSLTRKPSAIPPIQRKPVRNIRAAIPLTSKDDYPFYNVTINWDPPAHHSSVVVTYYVTLIAYKRCNGRTIRSYVDFYTRVTLRYTSISFPYLLPNRTYYAYVRAISNHQHWSERRSINFTTPDINRTELYVRFKGNQLNPSPKGNSFDVNISWDEPILNRGLIGYQFSYQVGNRKMVVNETKKTHLIIPEVMHGEQFTYKVTPKYNYKWLEGKEQLGKATAEVPPDDDVEVRNIEVGEFAPEKGNSTFSVKFSWTGPVFNFTLYGYHFNYERTGYKKHAITIKGDVTKPELYLSEIRPKETVRLKVTPMYENRYIQKIESEVMETAPAPRAELLAVRGLKNEELVPSSSTSFSTVVKWEKPLFTLSNVSYYVYGTTEEIKGQMKRRAIRLNNENTTTETSVNIDGIYQNETVEFQVIPVFDASVVTGVAAKISIVRTEPKADEALSTGFYTSGLIAGLVIGFLLVTFICMIFIWRRWRKQKMLKKKSLIPGKNRLIIDNWEVDGDLVTLEDEIGEGAFGKVYKGTLVKPTSSLHQRFCLKPWKKTSKTISGSETYVVAVKMLHNMPDESVRQEFLDEIQLMKAVGSHENIVSMVGCCTVEEPMFLLVEYAPYGDLLHHLRNHRKKASKDKRVYVNIPMSNEELGRSNTFTTPEDQIKIGGETKTLNTEEEEKEDCNEEILTPGNLMAFAWHVCQGMEYLARKGYVHRDLAARNVLIGEKKIAKVSDFGLSRYVYEEKVYHGKRNRKLPFKWMSTEAIFDQTFTTKSDVWAFGVVLWEMVTLGGTPYPTIQNKELLQLLKNGYRMEKPDTCNEELYKMMQDCWQDNPENRPTFTQIRESLETIMQKNNPYLDLTAVDESQAEYNVQSFDSMEEQSSDDETDDNVAVVLHEEAVENAKENISENDPKSTNQSVDINTKTETQPGTGSNDCAKNPQGSETCVLNLNTLETRF